MNFDAWVQFSDDNVQRRLAPIAERIGLHYLVDDTGRFQFRDSETREKGKDHPAVLALDDEFGPEWIALQMDSTDDLQRCVADLTQRDIRHLIEATEAGPYIIVDRSQCPTEWSDSQV